MVFQLSGSLLDKVHCCDSKKSISQYSINSIGYLYAYLQIRNVIIPTHIAYLNLTAPVPAAGAVQSRLTEIFSELLT